jgi:ribose/xylose/arabinose/galactoside ABC-type transport system permease subunit
MSDLAPTAPQAPRPRDAHGGSGARPRMLEVLAGDRLGTFAPWLSLAVLLIVSAAVSSSFLTSGNLLNISRQAAPLGMVALGEAIVILAGGIDVSVGAVISMTTVVTARVMQGDDVRIAPTIALALAIGLAVGLVNGTLVGVLRTDPFVTTLATMLVLQGAALVYTQGSPANDLTTGFRKISEGDVADVPISVICLAVLAVVVWFVVARSTFGRDLYAVGENGRVAFLSGRSVTRVVITSYVASGLLAAIAGVFLVARLGTGDVSAGSGWELEAISAVLIGGTALGGGRGGIAGPIAGVFILTVVFNLVNLLALPNYWQQIVRGVAIIVGVALYAHTTRARR